MPVFTIQPLDRAQTTSQMFRDHGITNGAPAQVANIKATILSGDLSPEAFNIRPCLPILTAMFMRGLPEMKATAFINAMTGTAKVPEIFPRPPLVVTTTNKSEDHIQRLTTLGFLPQSSQRYQYYSGPATDETIRQVAALGVNTACYSPYGSANVLGHLTLGMMTRLVYCTSRFQGNWNKQWPKMKDEGNEVILAVSEDLRPFITKEEDLPDSGLFFQYFDGLIMPDKSFTPSFMTRLFSQCLGDSPSTASAAIKTIFDGWSSLNTTPAGVQLSHFAFGANLALDGRLRIRAVVLSRQYKGFVVEGTKFKLHYGSEVISPVGKASLEEDINKVDSHALSLIQIALLLSDVPEDGKEEKTAVTDAMIASSRTLHNLLRVRTFSPETQEKLRGLTNALSFRETFWEPTDNMKLQVAIHNIVSRTFLPEDAPFAYKAGGALFTKDPVFSTLAAFGLRAPTLSLDKGANLPLPVNRPDAYKKAGKVTLKGIPYYLLPLQQAFEVWKITLASGVVNLKQAGNDKHGLGRLPGVYGQVPLDSPAGLAICADLLTVAKEAKQEGKGKRKADDQGGNNGGPKKKAKKQGGINDFMPALENEGGAAGPAHEDDDDMDDFW